MNDKIRVRFEAFERMVAFGRKYAGRFAAGSVALLRFANLGQKVAGLTDQKAKQGHISATPKSVLIDAVRLDVQNITRTARAIGQEELGFADYFRPPKTDTDGDVLSAADAILLNLVPAPTDSPAVVTEKAARVAKFVAHELPATFVTDLTTARAAVDTAEEGLDESVGGGVNATGAVERLCAEAMVEVKFLDAIMHNKFATEADVLREWMSAHHIERLPKGKDAKPSTSTPTPS